MKLGGKNVIGYIDRIEQTPQGDYHLIDYKTGGKNKKPDPVEDLQLNLYSQACKNGIKDKHGKTLVKAGTLPKKAILFYFSTINNDIFYFYSFIFFTNCHLVPFVILYWENRT